MLRRNDLTLTTAALMAGLLVGSQVMASDVISNANAGVLSAVEYLRGEHPFMFVDDRNTGINSVARIPHLQTSAINAAINTSGSWHGVYSRSADDSISDGSTIDLVSQKNDDIGLMTLVGAGLIILQLRRKQKSLQQRILAPG